MKANRRYIGTVILILAACSVFAQNQGYYWKNLNDLSNRLEGKLMGRVCHLSADINKNFLYPNEWGDGEVVLTNGDKFENLQMRYHANDDELIVYNENNLTLFFVEKQIVKSFSFEQNNKTRKFVILPSETDSTKYKYFEELYSGSRSLFAYYYVWEHKVNPYVDKAGIMRDTEFELQTNYFMYAEKQGFKKMAVNRRAFYTAFPENKKVIRKLFKKNGLIIQDEYDMIWAFRLLDEKGLFN